MIINEFNKNNILKGKVKRGFNQKPEEIQEKLIRNIREKEIIEKPKEKQIIENPKEKEDITSPAEKINKAMRNMRNFR